MQNMPATTTYAPRFVKPGKFFAENAANIDFLRAHEVAEQMGRLHRPQNHSDILQLFRAEAERRNLQLSRESGLLSLDGKALIYTAFVNENANPDMAYQIGFRNYNNMQIAFHGMFGAHIFVCTNGMCTGYIRPSRQKHIYEDLGTYQEKINVIFDYFPTASKELDDGISLLKTTQATDELVNKFIVQGMRDVFCPKVASQILAEYDKPTLNDPNDTSLWRLANAATYVTTHKMTGDITHREALSKYAWTSLRALAAN